MPDPVIVASLNPQPQRFEISKASASSSLVTISDGKIVIRAILKDEPDHEILKERLEKKRRELEASNDPANVLRQLIHRVLEDGEVLELQGQLEGKSYLPTMKLNADAVVKIEAHEGRLHFSGNEAKSVEIISDSGKIVLNLPKIRKLTLTLKKDATIGGDIGESTVTQASEIKCWALQLKTGNVVFERSDDNDLKSRLEGMVFERNEQKNPELFRLGKSIKLEKLLEIRDAKNQSFGFEAFAQACKDFNIPSPIFHTAQRAVAEKLNIEGEVTRIGQIFLDAQPGVDLGKGYLFEISENSKLPAVVDLAQKNGDSYVKPDSGPGIEYLINDDAFLMLMEFYSDFHDAAIKRIRCEELQREEDDLRNELNSKRDRLDQRRRELEEREVELRKSLREVAERHAKAREAVLQLEQHADIIKDDSELTQLQQDLADAPDLAAALKDRLDKHQRAQSQLKSAQANEILAKEAREKAEREFQLPEDLVQAKKQLDKDGTDFGAEESRARILKAERDRRESQVAAQADLTVKMGSLFDKLRATQATINVLDSARQEQPEIGLMTR